MSKFNVNTIGRVTRDPELKFLPNGTPVASFGLATNKGYMKDGEWQEKTIFSDWQVWRDRAQLVADKLKKGTKVYLEGEYEPNSWETKEGEKRTAARFNLNYFEIQIGSAAPVETKVDVSAVETIVEEDESESIPF